MASQWKYVISQKISREENGERMYLRYVRSSTGHGFCEPSLTPLFEKADRYSIYEVASLEVAKLGSEFGEFEVVEVEPLPSLVTDTSK